MKYNTYNKEEKHANKLLGESKGRINTKKCSLLIS